MVYPGTYRRGIHAQSIDRLCVKHIGIRMLLFYNRLNCFEIIVFCPLVCCRDTCNTSIILVVQQIAQSAIYNGTPTIFGSALPHCHVHITHQHIKVSPDEFIFADVLSNDV